MWVKWKYILFLFVFCPYDNDQGLRMLNSYMYRYVVYVVYKKDCLKIGDLSFDK